MVEATDGMAMESTMGVVEKIASYRRQNLDRGTSYPEDSQQSRMESWTVVAHPLSGP